MNELYYRIIVAALFIGVVGIRILVIDTLPSTRIRKRGGVYEVSTYTRILLIVLSIVQIMGFDAFRLNLGSAVDTIVRAAGILLMLIGSVTMTWPRLMSARRKAWAHPGTSRSEIPGHTLVRDGPYRFVRHPYYAGIVVGFLGLELSLASWLVVLVLPVVYDTIRQIKREEGQLLRDYGDEYRAYRSRTWRLIPFVY